MRLHVNTCLDVARAAPAAEPRPPDGDGFQRLSSPADATYSGQKSVSEKPGMVSKPWVVSRVATSSSRRSTWQPPSHARGGAQGQRRRPMGEPASAVLALTGAVRHRLDERERVPSGADRGLRNRPARRRRRVLRAAEDSAADARQSLARRGDRPRPEGQGLAVPVLPGHRPVPGPAVAGHRDLRRCGPDVALAGPALRTANDRSRGRVVVTPAGQSSGFAVFITWSGASIRLPPRPSRRAGSAGD